MANYSFKERLKNAWNVFQAKEDNSEPKLSTFQTSDITLGYNSSARPDRVRLTAFYERTIIAAIYTRIATDVAAIPIQHVRVDQNGQYLETIPSSLQECLTISANVDQTGRELIFDAVMSLFDEGVVALVPVDTSVNLIDTSTFDILSLRTGKITQWFPQHIKVEVYDDRVGTKKDILMPKEKVAIVENPFYAVMNQPNSTLRRLIHKLGLLDNADDQNAEAKFNMIIQLPYTIKTEARRKEAEERRENLERQLIDSKYGIAYIDSTENVTQLGREISNNLLDQIDYLTKLLYSQLGITENILNNTASEQEQINYYNSTIEPILSAIVNEMHRKFLTKTARTQQQCIYFVRNPFKLVPVNQVTEVADKFTRNEILSSNEIRSIIGFKPIDDERANELRNKNINASNKQLDETPVLTNQEGNSNNEESDIEESSNNINIEDLMK